ncbi:MAG TPA: discoidin domain-containing protein, partial [Planctomycetota bacterium]|nr:discoidin domain-containing protein [Planctomycetota bacterium]
CLYFVDMYRGIIQESNWVRPDSYLRPQVLALGLDHNIGRGRIWRLVHDSKQPAPAPRLRQQTSAQLVQELAHPDGWRRDTAQQLLVLRHATDAAEALRALASHGPTPLARVHALWTLDGLGLTTRDLLVAAFTDADARVRETAVRVGETLLRAGDHDLLPQLRKLSIDPAIDVRAQVLRSLRYVAGDAGRDFVIDLIAANPKNELLQATGQSSLRRGADQEEPGLANLTAADLLRWKNGREIFRTLCITCHGPDGKGMPSGELRLAPPLTGSRWLLHNDEVAIRILLYGMTGAIDGVEYPGNLMAPQHTNPDTWIADVLTYARSSFGNAGAPVHAADVARVRQQCAGRSQPWRPDDLQPLLPVAKERMAQWQLTASHAGEPCERAIDGDPATRWTTGVDLQPGLWFQIDFGAPFTVRELRLDTRRSPGDYPRAFDLVVADDGEHWSQPLVSGTGDGPMTVITVATPRAARFLRIEQTGRQSGLWWSIHELQVFGR